MVIRSLCVSLAFSVIATLNAAHADDKYPSRTVTLVIPNTAGGGMDMVGRILGQKLSTALGQTVVVENRPGAAENIGINAVAKAQGDGYTLLLSSNTITINPSLFKKLAYNAEQDLQPLGKATSLALMVVVNQNSPFKTFNEMISFAKANPGKLTYGSPGVGTPHHLGMELLKNELGVDITHVPYRGAAPGVTDLLTGTISLLVTTIAPVEANLQAEKFRPLVTFSSSRLKQYPNVVSVSETAPKFNVDIWHGVFAPASTPKPIADKLIRAIKGVVEDPNTAADLRRVGVEPSWTAPADLRLIIKTEQAQWSVAIKKAGIEAN